MLQLASTGVYYRCGQKQCMVEAAFAADWFKFNLGYFSKKQFTLKGQILFVKDVTVEDKNVLSACFDAAKRFRA